MSRAERAFAQVVVASLVTGSFLALPLLITLFPGAIEQALHGYGAIAAVCAAAIYQIGRELPPLGTVVLGLAGVSVVLTALKVTRTLRHTRRALADHRPAATPARLTAAAGAVGVARDVVCFADARAFAYCRGFLRPRIWISSGALRRLRRRELEAVLLHEDFHRRQRDPLRILISRVLGQILYAIPLIGLLAARFEVAKELDADRAAVQAQGTTRYLARALYSLARDPLALASGEVAVGAWSLTRSRVDQLCGSADEVLLPSLSRGGRLLTTAVLALALALTLGQAARANLLPAAVVAALMASPGAPAVHVCPLPVEGVLF